MKWRAMRVLQAAVLALALGADACAQRRMPSAARESQLEAGNQVATANPAAAEEAAPLPTGYVIGSDDILSIVFWREKDLSADVVVRPDGKVSLPLLNEVQAAGLTPEQLRAELNQMASKYIEAPNASVVVKAIHSRNVFITGNVAKPGTYPLTGELTVVQLVALAGGLQEFADAKNIVIVRTRNGRAQYLNFNYQDFVKQKNTDRNITLTTGDTIIVP